MYTGFQRFGRPSVGSWTLYGLGTENQNMPGFVTIGSPAEWRQSSFLPGIYQGTHINTRKTRPEELIENIRNGTLPMPLQRRQLDLLKEFNADHQRARSSR